MTDRGLKIALAVSVAVNIFVAGVVVTGLAVGLRGIPDRPHGDRPPVFSLVQSLDEGDREEAQQALRSAALSARGDFEEARRLRAEAIDLAGADTFDRPAVEAALARSREAEASGRARLEGTMLDLLERLDQDDRQRLAPAFARRGRERGHHRRFRDGRGPETPPTAEAPASPVEG